MYIVALPSGACMFYIKRKRKEKISYNETETKQNDNQSLKCNSVFKILFYCFLNIRIVMAHPLFYRGLSLVSVYEVFMTYNLTKKIIIKSMYKYIGVCVNIYIRPKLLFVLCFVCVFNAFVI